MSFLFRCPKCDYVAIVRSKNIEDWLIFSCFCGIEWKYNQQINKWMDVSA